MTTIRAREGQLIHVDTVGTDPREKQISLEVCDEYGMSARVLLPLAIARRIAASLDHAATTIDGQRANRRTAKKVKP